MRLLSACRAALARAPLAWPVGAAVRDVVVVVVLLVLGTAVARLCAARGLVPLDHATLILALVTVAVSAMAAILAHAVGRLAGDHRAVWLSLMFALYSLIVVPVATIGAATPTAAAAIGAARLVADLVLVALLPAVCRGRPMSRARARWLLAGLAVLLTVTAAVAASLNPSAAYLVIGYVPLRLGLAMAGAAFGVVLAGIGWAGRSVPLARVGLGCAAIGLSYGYRLGLGQWPVAPLDLGFSTMRLVGALLALFGLVQLVRGAIGTARTIEARRTEELRRAKLDLHRAEERDHELRNGFAGLAAAAHVLRSHTPADPSDDALSEAVATELARLDALLGSSGHSRRPHGPRRSPPGIGEAFPIEPLLRQRVAPHRSAGMSIELDVDSAVWAIGSPSVVAGVIDDVLAGRAKRAPATPILVLARRRGGSVRIRISELGAKPPHVDTAVPAMGSVAAGSLGGADGRLLRAYGGRISVPSPGGGHQGWAVVVELPAATCARRTDQVSAQ